MLRDTLLQAGRRSLPWFGKGIWTILDQGLFAGSNFVLNVLLARWLAPDAYGAFTVAYTVFLLLGTLQGGFLTEPMLVFGPGRYRDRLLPYLRLLLRVQAGFALVFGLLLLFGGSVVALLGPPVLGRTLVVLATAQYFILFLWLARQACYVQTRPHWAASGGFIYAALMLTGAAAAAGTGVLTAEVALGILSASSMVAGVWLLFRLRVNPFALVEATMRREVIQDHREYGRWAAATGILEWVPGYLPFLLLPLWAGLEASGALKALLNLIMPAAHAYGAIGLLLVPVFVRAREHGHFHRLLLASLGGVALATSLYWLLLGYGGPTLLHWLYEGYTELGHLLWLVGCIPFMAGLAAMLRTALRALERPNLVFWAYLGSSAVAITAGSVLIYHLGLVGALYGFIAQMVVELGVMAFFLLRHEPVPAATVPAEIG